MGAHRTGVNVVYDFRRRMGLTRQTAVVGAVGGSFDLVNGIKPGAIAR